MKISFIFLFFLLASINLKAQVTITFDNYQPEPNETYSYYTSDTSISEGNSGADITWDFSNIPQGTTQYDYTVKSCIGNGDCDSFPSADYFTHVPEGDHKIFHINNLSGVQINGRGTAFGSFIYTDPQMILKFPMTYLNTYYDSFACYYIIPFGNINYGANGLYNQIVDGYGTLKTPQGIYTGVLRVKSNITIHYYGATGATPQIEENYLWYQPGISHAIMQIRYVLSDPSKTVTYTTTSPKNTGETALSNIDADMSLLKIYPNPAINSFNIDFSGSKVNEIMVKDIVGKSILKKKIPNNAQNNYSIEILTSSWSKGVYIIEVSTSEKSYFRKIIIE